MWQIPRSDPISDPPDQRGGGNPDTVQNCECSQFGLALSLSLLGLVSVTEQFEGLIRKEATELVLVVSHDTHSPHGERKQKRKRFDPIPCSKIMFVSWLAERQPSRETLASARAHEARNRDPWETA